MHDHIARRCGLVLLASSVLALKATSGMEIVADGTPRAVIVLPDAANPVVQYAVTELQWHIERATGVRLTTMVESQATTAPLSRIYVGPCRATAAAGVRMNNLPANAFRIRIAKDAMFLVGVDGAGTPPGDDVTPMGTLFAVYEWLDKQVGVRWLWPGELGTVIPHVQRLTSGRRTDRTMAPAFIHTRLRFGGGLDWRIVQTVAAHQRFLQDTSVWLRRHRFARPVNFDYPHAYETYWDRFGTSHPEYFARRPDGKREPYDNEHHLVQMCVSSPELHKQIVADWLTQRTANPQRPWINAAENDKRAEDPSCTCEACRAWDSAKTPGSLSDRYAKFWLAVQAEARKHDPEATVAAYAYADYSLPPVETKLNDHIIVWVVPPYAFPLPPERRKAFRALWDGWARTGARLVLRPNYFLDGYCLPYVMADEFGSEFKYAWRHGLIGTDFDSLTSMWGVQGPNLYTLGRIHAQPELKVGTILDEYYAGFGPAAKAVRAYFDFWARVTAKMDDGFRKRAAGGWSPLSTAGDELYTPTAFKEGYALLEPAKRAAADDAEALQRVQFLAIWLKHAELAINALAAHHASLRAPGDAALKAALTQARQNLDQYRRDNAAPLADMNVAFVNQLEIWSGWRHRPTAPP